LSTSLTLRIVRPSSREGTDLLAGRIAELRAAGHVVRHDDIAPDPDWAYAAGTAKDRASALQAALLEPGVDAVLCARGGYGASDLLPLLDYESLAAATPRLLVGFSDVSALHSALYAKVGWNGLHAPMPATTLWRQEGLGDDVDQLLALLAAARERREMAAALPVAPVGATPSRNVGGRLYGGCFTVLTGLLGTSYFPKTLAGHLLFLEDTDEHPGRLMRALNQWLQAGALAGVRGLVIGHLRSLGPKIPDNAAFVLAQFQARTGMPVFHTPLFGHTSPNLPLLVGADAEIAGGQLAWRHTQSVRGRSRA
jgi:muramoyltetrapeptide carboxypeptidase